MSNLYRQGQVYNLARAAGFDEADAEVAAAIAMAESLTMKSGVQYANFDMVGDQHLVTSKWGPSYGAWQVRSLIAERGTGSYRDANRLPEPEFNARAAYSIFKAAGYEFTPWSTFLNGTYRGYMLQAEHNPVPTQPPGTYMVTGGDSLSKIGTKVSYEWRLIAAINNLVSPYTIFPGQVLLLPAFPYTIKSGDTLSKIASEVAHVTWQRIAEYNKAVLPDPNRLKVGQTISIPRYTSWVDGILER